MKLKLFLVSILALLSLVAYKTHVETKALKSIDSYESCVSAKGSVIQESYPATCITRLGTRFTQSTTSTQTDLPLTSNWTNYKNSNWKINFLYPPNWKIEELTHEIRVFPVGYLPDAFFTLKITTQSLDSIVANRTKEMKCNFQIIQINNQGLNRNIRTSTTYDECVGKVFGYYMLYGENSNVLIEHSFNDSGSNQSVGAILSTFEFTN